MLKFIIKATIWIQQIIEFDKHNLQRIGETIFEMCSCYESELGYTSEHSRGNCYYGKLW